MGQNRRNIGIRIFEYLKIRLLGSPFSIWNATVQIITTFFTAAQHKRVGSTPSKRHWNQLKFWHPTPPYWWRHRLAVSGQGDKSPRHACLWKSPQSVFRLLLFSKKSAIGTIYSLLRSNHEKFGHRRAPYRWHHCHFRFRYIPLRHSPIEVYAKSFFHALLLSTNASDHTGHIPISGQ